MATGRSKPAVLVLIPGFPADEQDTECLPAVQNVVRALARTDSEWEFLIIPFQYPYDNTTYKWHGIPVEPLDGRNRRFPGRFLTWVRSAWRTHRQSRRHSIELVHSFWLGECTLLGQWISGALHAPLIATIGGQDARPDNRYLSLIDLDRISTVAGSRFVAETFHTSTGYDANSVIPLGLDTDNLPEGASSGERPIDLLGVGSLTEVKDFSAFVEVVGRVAETFPRLRARIIGDGPRRDELAARIRELDLDDHLTLTGECPRPEVLRSMSQAKILLHPSTYEAQGYVLMEALASGAHVIQRPVGWMSDSEQVHISTSIDEMASNVIRLLESNRTHRSVAVPSARDSARAYLELYETH